MAPAAEWILNPQVYGLASFPHRWTCLSQSNFVKNPVPSMSGLDGNGQKKLLPAETSSMTRQAFLVSEYSSGISSYWQVFHESFSFGRFVQSSVPCCLSYRTLRFLNYGQSLVTAAGPHLLLVCLMFCFFCSCSDSLGREWEGRPLPTTGTHPSVVWKWMASPSLPGLGTSNIYMNLTQDSRLDHLIVWRNS